MKKWVVPLLLLCFMLCGCGGSKINLPEEQVQNQDVQGSVSEPQEGSGVSQDIPISSEPDSQEDIPLVSDDLPEEPSYNEQYYTSEDTSTASIVQTESEPSAEKEISVEQTQIAAVGEYAACLYPEQTVADVTASSRTVDGTDYIFFEVKDKASTICTIAYQEQNNIYYLYDSEVMQLIPIEYDEYGVRLVS